MAVDQVAVDLGQIDVVSSREVRILEDMRRLDDDLLQDTDALPVVPVPLILAGIDIIREHEQRQEEGMVELAHAARQTLDAASYV